MFEPFLPLEKAKQIQDTSRFCCGNLDNTEGWKSRLVPDLYAIPLAQWLWYWLFVQAPLVQILSNKAFCHQYLIT